VLIDKALTRGYVLSPLAAPHHRRDGLVFRWPSDKGTQVRPSPDGGRGHHRLTYGQVWGWSYCTGPSASDGRDPVVEPGSEPEMRACSEIRGPWPGGCRSQIEHDIVVRL
jgi:hypothetical protein